MLRTNNYLHFVNSYLQLMYGTGKTPRRAQSVKTSYRHTRREVGVGCSLTETLSASVPDRPTASYACLGVERQIILLRQLLTPIAVRLLTDMYIPAFQPHIMHNPRHNEGVYSTLCS